MILGMTVELRCDAGLLDRAKVRNKQKSTWLIQNLKAFGKVLGASYEAFEDKVENLLLEIEARRNQRLNAN